MGNVAFNLHHLHDKPGIRERAGSWLQRQASRFRGRGLTEAQYERLVQLIGSFVPSKSRDQYANQWRYYGLTNETQQLYRLYVELEEDYNSENLLDAATKRLTRGISKFDYAIEPKVQSDQARTEAKWAQQVCEVAAEMLQGDMGLGGCDYDEEEDQPITLADMSEMLGRYSNLPVQLAYDQAGIITALRAMPPFAWTKRNDHKFRWEDKNCAYTQHDTETWEVTDPFPARNIVWAMSNRRPWERYAVPRALNMRVHVRGLIDLFKNLPDARLHATPEKVYLRDKPMDKDEFNRFVASMPKNRVQRGDQPNIWDFDRLLQGFKDAKVISVTTDFFQQFGDMNAFNERIALGYDLTIATLLGQEKVNRATLEFLLRMEKIAQLSWMENLTRSLIFPTFRRAIKEAGLNRRFLRCEVRWEKSETPEELAAKGEAARAYYLDGVISRDDYQSVACSHLGKDQKATQRKIEEEKAAGIVPPQTQRTSLQVSGVRNNPLFNLPGSNIRNQVEPVDLDTNQVN